MSTEEQVDWVGGNQSQPASDLFLAIDPGIKGAIALLNGRKQFLEVADLPVMAKSATKNKLNAAALSLMVQEWQGIHGLIGSAMVENVWAMPKQGASSGFSLGHSVGVCEGVLLGLGIPTEMIIPQTWKKHFKLTSDKELCRAKAISYYPLAPLSRKKDADRAEALLMARYLIER
ncbi:hypothetical protein [uncultured Amphritea sp.]|uniref:hypothetical protein n=1 Tax=uncultured Amphritea sp. TaxID=981605 RepID=UPI00261DFD86|nr:hypothetical protein [uncultured Amphritea sp.]